MSPKYKLRNYGEESTRPTDRRVESDAGLALLNHKAYRERKKRVCAFEGCTTLIRYRSEYAPYCDLHRTEALRGQPEH